MGKRRREPVSVDVQLVEIYEDLANENEEIRLKGALALVSKFSPDQQPAAEEIEKVLRRLFRGLCSGRKAARVGFSIALTELLAQTVNGDDAKVGKVIEILEAQTTSNGNVPGQEERNYFLGRLFGAEAIIKSSILFQKGVSFDRWTKILDVIFGLAQKKPWLREECGWIIFRAIPDLVAQKVEAKYVEVAIRQLSVNNLARTPEGVAIWIAVRKLYPAVPLPKDIFKHDDPLQKSETVHLAKIMKEASVSESASGKDQTQSGIWNSKLHFAWDALLSEFISRDQNASKEGKPSKSKQINFSEFWIEIVDNSLFAASSSEERKYWGFLLFCKVLQDAPQNIASQIFSKNLIRCMINQSTGEDRYLHRMSIRATKAIQSRVAAEPSFAVAAVKGLMGTQGAINFDQITKTKTVEKILTEASESAIEELVPLFECLISKPGVTEAKAATSKRQYLADLLLNTVRARTAAAKDKQETESDSSAWEVLKLFIKFAYFVQGDGSKSGKKTPEPQLEQATRDTYQNRIMSCLTSLIASRSNPSELPYSVVRLIHEAETNGEFGECIVELEGSVKSSVKSAFKTLKKIHSKSYSGKETSGFQALQLLYSLTILQVYNGDGDAVSMLDELKTCYSTLSGSEAPDGEEAGEASDTLVEILLSFASKPSQLFRKMGQQVFGAFCPLVTVTGLQSLITVLEAKESLAGQKEMFDEQNSDEEADSDINMSDAEDSDVEIIEASDVEEVNAEEESSNESSPDSDEEDDELAAFNAKLAEALGTSTNMDDNANSSDSDADMNDDEMEALDSKLTEVFRARNQATTKKQDKKGGKETMINFKNRVLDLLEIYVKKEHRNPLALDLLMPLLILIRKTSVKQLGDRAVGIIREYARLCKGSNLPTLETSSPDSDSDADADADADSSSDSDFPTPSPLWPLLISIHEEACKASTPAHTTACSNASLLIVKALIAGAENHPKRSASSSADSGDDDDAEEEDPVDVVVDGVVDVYAATRKRQLRDRTAHVAPAFFSEWNNWCVSAGKGFRG